MRNVVLQTAISLMRRQLFFRSVGFLLVVTALAKLFSAGGSAKVLGMEDPIFQVTYKELMLAVAVIEIAVVGILAFSEDVWIRSLSILALSANFAIYRIGMDALDVKICPCVGTLGQRLGLTQAQIDGILGASVLYMLIGSAAIILSLWQKTDERSGPMSQANLPVRVNQS
jgi:hypothetical protein